MVVEVGLTAREVPLPMGEPPQDPLYHSQVAPVPNDPPTTDKVVGLPEQMVVEVAVAEVGLVDRLPMLSCISKMVLTLAVLAVLWKKAPPTGSVVGKSVLLE